MSVAIPAHAAKAWPHEMNHTFLPGTALGPEAGGGMNVPAYPRVKIAWSAPDGAGPDEPPLAAAFADAAAPDNVAELDDPHAPTATAANRATSTAPHARKER